MRGITNAVAAARMFQDAVNITGLGNPASESPSRPHQNSRIELFDRLVTVPSLRATTRQLYLDGHFRNAVEDAFKLLNNTVKRKSGYQKDGTPLMQEVFREHNPVLKLNSMKTSSEVNEQVGYQMILAGCMRGIRNPRAHEHDLRDDSEAALEMLVLANHLLRMVDRADGVPRLSG